MHQQPIQCLKKHYYNFPIVQITAILEYPQQMFYGEKRKIIIKASFFFFIVFFFGLQKSLPYNFSPSGGKMHFQFYFCLMSLPFIFGTEILHFYMQFCLKIIVFAQSKLFISLYVFLFLPSYSNFLRNFP